MVIHSNYSLEITNYRLIREVNVQLLVNSDDSIMIIGITIILVYFSDDRNVCYLANLDIPWLFPAPFEHH